MKLILVLTTILTLFIGAKTVCVTNFYWLEYSGGAMPDTVLQVDPATAPDLYVGQYYTKKYELIPAFVKTTRPYATSSAYSEVYSGDIQIKVLASQCKGNFQWVPTDAAGYRSLPYMVPAGSEINKQLYFGRFFVNDTQVLGKLNSGYNGVTAPYNGAILARDTNFTVLTYLPPAKYGCLRNIKPC